MLDSDKRDEFVRLIEHAQISTIHRALDRAWHLGYRAGANRNQGESMPADNTVLMEGVRLIFRNLTGKEGQYNREGDRNFGVILPDDVAEQMLADGWNVKYLQPREDTEEETPTPWLPVKVGYGKGRPPKIMLVTDRGRTALDESTVETLDWAEITNVDLIVRPYNYEVNGRTGISAYVQSMYVTIEEDALERKYAEMDSQ